MHVGSLRVRLIIRHARTLKDKRQVVRSMVDKLRQGFNAAVTEVDAQDDCQRIVLGVVTLSDDAAVVQHTLDQITNALRSHPVAEFVLAERLIDSPDLRL